MSRRSFIFALFLALLVPLTTRAQEITEPARKRVILSGLKLWYYDLNRFGFPGFTCDVTASAIDELSGTLSAGLPPNDPIVKLVRSMKTTLAVNRRGEFTITSGKLKLSGNQHADEGARQALAGVKQSLTGVMNLWRPLVFGAYFTGNEADYAIFEDSGSYTITSPKEEVEIRVTKEFLITGITVGSGDTRVDMVPTFAEIDNTRLVERIEAKVGTLMNIGLGFTYGKFSWMRLPTAIDASVVMFQGPDGESLPQGDTTRMTITLTNHKIPKK